MTIIGENDQKRAEMLKTVAALNEGHPENDHYGVVTNQGAIILTARTREQKWTKAFDNQDEASQVHPDFKPGK